MPAECKERLLQFFASHDQLSTSDCDRLICSPYFGTNLSELTFFLTHDLTDNMLRALTVLNKRLTKITLVECTKVTDQGIQWATMSQQQLRVVELRSMHLTDESLKELNARNLHTLDLSGCGKFTSIGLRDVLIRHQNIQSLYLNHCSSLDDTALYYIAEHVGDRLQVLQMDFPSSLLHPGASLNHLSLLCPNLSQLSIARFFNDNYEGDHIQPEQCKIDGINLRDVDLYGNYFSSFPLLPPTVCSLRISLSGNENPAEIVECLETQPYLESINLQLTVQDGSIASIDNANNLLSYIMPFLGPKITILQVSVSRLFDEALRLILDNTPNMTHLALAVNHLNTNILQRYFAGGSKSRGSTLQSLKICRMRITYRILFAIAKGAKNLVDLETSHMSSIDDRFISLLGDNCRRLQTVNFNGCRWVTDKGICNLAKRCPLREVRIRGTACTDKSVYQLAQFCPDLEWISYADYSGRPKFTETALQCLRDSCIQRVIC
ncbi:unnamed protein product [Auanema sp. JU1783]|nr:unnamed protein product [Auanema sp. JU1783]